MNFEERVLSFPCNRSSLYGVLNVPERCVSRGVLIVVGGPQYRAGSHRQFVLLARHLAAHGLAVMRFDYRGMGDSEGAPRTFEEVDDDIRHAVDRFFSEVPAIREVIIWGLCDAASAAMFYAHQDPRVSGLVLLNPWVRTDGGMTKVYLKHYYLARLFDQEVWTKIFRGRLDYANAARSIWRLLGEAIPAMGRSASTASSAKCKQSDHPAPLPERMFNGLDRFGGKVLLIMSGNDLTAQEFLELVKSSRKWQKLLEPSRVQRRDLPQANHTFSQSDWRNQVATWTREWMVSW
jgi:exosortase A-associated hydrolase 1